MTRPLPFAPSLAWVARYLESGEIGIADWHTRARCTLRGSNGAFTLTVPVEGGRTALKRRDSNPLLSEHGKWRHEHLGAWNAAYGKTPYFNELMCQLTEVYKNSETSKLSLNEFNVLFLKTALSWIEYADILPHRDRLKLKIVEMREKVSAELSIFDALFRFGKETVFALL